MSQSPRSGRRRAPSQGNCQLACALLCSCVRPNPRQPANPPRRPRIIDDPDRELVARWQSGDESAFEELVRIHERRVFGMLYRMMGTREEAEDVAQETFLSLHRHGRSFRRHAIDIEVGTTNLYQPTTTLRPSS